MTTQLEKSFLFWECDESDVWRERKVYAKGKESETAEGT